MVWASAGGSLSLVSPTDVTRSSASPTEGAEPSTLHGSSPLRGAAAAAPAAAVRGGTVAAAPVTERGATLVANASVDATRPVGVIDTIDRMLQARCFGMPTFSFIAGAMTVQGLALEPYSRRLVPISSTVESTFVPVKALEELCCVRSASTAADTPTCASTSALPDAPGAPSVSLSSSYPKALTLSRCTYGPRSVASLVMRERCHMGSAVIVGGDGGLGGCVGVTAACDSTCGDAPGEAGGEEGGEAGGEPRSLRTTLPEVSYRIVHSVLLHTMCTVLQLCASSPGEKEATRCVAAKHCRCGSHAQVDVRVDEHEKQS